MPKYKLRMMLIMFILGAVPVIAVGLISYFTAADYIEERTQESNMQLLNQTQMNVEQVLRTLELSALQFLNSPEVTALDSNTLSAEDYVRIRALSKGLYHIQTFAAVSEATLIHLKQQWLINFNLFQRLHDNPQREKYLAYARYPNPMQWIAEKNGGLGSATGASTVSLVVKIPQTAGPEEPRAVLVAQMLDSELNAFLSENKRLGTSYIMDREGQPVLSLEGTGSQSEWNHSLSRQLAEGGPMQGFFYADSKEGRMGVTYRMSPYNGWIYVSAVALEEMQSASRKIAVVTIAVCLLVLAAVAAAALVGSRRMYTPVRRLFEFSREVAGIRMEEMAAAAELPRDEFSFIEDRLRQLASRGVELQDQIRGHAVQLREYHVIKLLTSPIHESDFKEGARMYGFPQEWRHMAVLTLQIDTMEGSRYQERDRDLLLFAVSNMASELIRAEYRFTPVVLDQSQVTLVASPLEDPAQMKQELYRMAEQIKRKVDEFLKLTVSIGISKPYKDMTQTQLAYQQSLQALRCRRTLGNDIIVQFEDMERGSGSLPSIYSHLKLLEDQLLEMLRAGDAPRAAQLFEEYAGSLSRYAENSTEHPALMVQLISKLYHLVMEQGGTVSQVLGPQSSLEHFMKLNSMEAIAEWMKGVMFEPIARYLNDQGEGQYSEITKGMIQLIHELYMDEMNLELCAARMNFHPVYLSRVFKKETGVNFIEYLVEYRMGKAKEWLAYTNDKIADIAARLQYANTSAFIRTFRRTVGMTPGQYRTLTCQDKQ